MARGLSLDVIKVINEDDKFYCLRNIFEEAMQGTNRDKPLLVCLRDNKIDIYYNGCSTINIDVKGGMLSGNISKSYTLEEIEENDIKIQKESNKKSSTYQIREDDINVCTIDKMTNFVRGKNERAVQQQIIMCNNESAYTEWYCVDMEYNTGEYGEFDIVAVSKKENSCGKYEMIIVELKEVHKSPNKKGGMTPVTGSMNGGDGESGIYDHFINFEGFLNDSSSVKNLKESIINILKNKSELGLCDDEISGLSSRLTIESLGEPQFVFLTYCRDDTMSTAKNTFKNKVFGDNAGRTIKTIKKFLEQENKNIKEIPTNLYRCIFKKDEVVGPIFNDINITEAKNIFDEEAYK